MHLLDSWILGRFPSGWPVGKNVYTFTKPLMPAMYPPSFPAATFLRPSLIAPQANSSIMPPPVTSAGPLAITDGPTHTPITTPTPDPTSKSTTAQETMTHSFHGSLADAINAAHAPLQEPCSSTSLRRPRETMSTLDNAPSKRPRTLSIDAHAMHSTSPPSTSPTDSQNTDNQPMNVDLMQEPAAPAGHTTTGPARCNADHERIHDVQMIDQFPDGESQHTAQGDGVRNPTENIAHAGEGLLDDDTPGPSEHTDHNLADGYDLEEDQDAPPHDSTPAPSPGATETEARQGAKKGETGHDATDQHVVVGHDDEDCRSAASDEAMGHGAQSDPNQHAAEDDESELSEHDEHGAVVGGGRAHEDAEGSTDNEAVSPLVPSDQEEDEILDMSDGDYVTVQGRRTRRSRRFTRGLPKSVETIPTDSEDDHGNDAPDKIMRSPSPLRQDSPPIPRVSPSHLSEPGSSSQSEDESGAAATSPTPNSQKNKHRDNPAKPTIRIVLNATGKSAPPPRRPSRKGASHTYAETRMTTKTRSKAEQLRIKEELINGTEADVEDDDYDSDVQVIDVIPYDHQKATADDVEVKQEYLDKTIQRVEANEAQDDEELAEKPRIRLQTSHQVSPHAKGDYPFSPPPVAHVSGRPQICDHARGERRSPAVL